MIYGVARAEQFSPQSVEKDRAILEAVVERLHGILISEQQLCDADLMGMVAYIKAIWYEIKKET